MGASLCDHNVCLSVCLSVCHALILQRLSTSWNIISVVKVKNNRKIYLRFRKFCYRNLSMICVIIIMVIENSVVTHPFLWVSSRSEKDELWSALCNTTCVVWNVFWGRRKGLLLALSNLFCGISVCPSVRLLEFSQTKLEVLVKTKWRKLMLQPRCQGPKVIAVQLQSYLFCMWYDGFATKLVRFAEEISN